MPTLETNTPNKPYFNIPFLPLENDDQSSRHGAQFFRNVKQLQVGFGSSVFRVDRDGMWAGAETYAGAPWKVDWDGNMTASSITISGYVPTGGALGDTQTSIGAGGLSAITANLGTITAGTITGVLFRTAASGVRIEMDTTNTNQIRFYDSTTLFGQLEAYKVGSDGYIGLLAQDDGAGFEVYTGVGASAYSAVTIFSNGGSFTSDGNASNGFNTINGKYGGYFGVFGDGSAVDYISTDLAVDADWIPYTGGYDLGSSGVPWARGYFEDCFVSDDLTVTDTIIYGGVTIPTLYHGYVSSGATFGNPTPSGWSVSSSSTGIYTVTHNFGHVGYAVVVVPKASTVKNITVSDKSSNSFTVRIANLSDTLEDNDFMFIVTRTI